MFGNHEKNVGHLFCTDKDIETTYYKYPREGGSEAARERERGRERVRERERKNETETF